MNTRHVDVNRGCPHDVYIKGLCGNCGIRLDPPQQSSSVSMIHSVPELKVSTEYAKEIGKADQNRLISDRKLVLLVDLDQTLLHTTHEPIKDDPNVHSFQLWPGHPIYYTKLRPHLKEFLDQMVKIYELHIFTFGCRKYAHKIASIIDPDRTYFGNRILSRDESVDQYYKKGNLNNLFPCGDAMVCIIDDRADVWREAGNLIQVKAYTYFKTSISDGAMLGASSSPTVDDESFERDVHKLDALLGLDDDDIEEATGPSEPSEPSAGPAIKKQKVAEQETTMIESGTSHNSPGDGGAGTHEDGSVTTSGDEDTKSSMNDEKDLTTEQRQQANEAQSTSESESEVGGSPQGGGKDNEDDDDEDDEDDDDDDDDDDDEGDDEGLGRLREQEQLPEDLDDHLLHLPVILSRIHEKWYMELDEQRRFLVEGESYKLPDIKDIIKKYLRRRH